MGAGSWAGEVYPSPSSRGRLDLLQGMQPPGVREPPQGSGGALGKGLTQPHTIHHLTTQAVPLPMGSGCKGVCTSPRSLPLLPASPRAQALSPGARATSMDPASPARVALSQPTTGLHSALMAAGRESLSWADGGGCSPGVHASKRQSTLVPGSVGVCVGRVWGACARCTCRSRSGGSLQEGSRMVL